MNDERPSYVYFIGSPDGGCIKIGCSKLPFARLMNLASWSPIKLELLAFVQGGFNLEFHLHTHFFKDHSHHEWFRPSDELRGLIVYAQRMGKLPEWAIPKGPVSNPRAARSKPSAVRTPEWRAQQSQALKEAWIRKREREAREQATP